MDSKIISFNSIKKIPLDLYLSDKEMERYKKLAEFKKSDWLSGRFVVKKAIQIHFKNLSKKIKLKEIEIIGKRFNKPDYKIPHLGVEHGTNISISHSDGFSFAAISDNKKQGLVGVDIEKIRDFKSDVLKSFLTAKEFSKLSEKKSCDKNKTATLFWCLKESYLKALGRGLICHPKNIEIDLDIKKNNYRFYDEGKEIKVKILWSDFLDNYLLAKVNVFNYV